MQNGMHINGKHYELNVRTPEEIGEKELDLLIVATKYDALEGILPDVSTMVSDKTLVLCLLNGVDSEEIISQVVNPDNILYSFMRIASERNGNEIRFNETSVEGVIMGEKDSSEPTERVLAVADLFKKAGVGCRLSSDIIAEKWNKYCLNISYNLPQAVLGIGYAGYFDSEHVGWIRDSLEKEVREVAAAYGITFGKLTNTRERQNPYARFSTLQDLDAGRHTEIEMFAGVLLKKAAQKHIAVPTVAYTYHLIKALEEKNDGLFNYGEKGM